MIPCTSSVFYPTSPLFSTAIRSRPHGSPCRPPPSLSSPPPALLPLLTITGPSPTPHFSSLDLSHLWSPPLPLPLHLNRLFSTWRPAEMIDGKANVTWKMSSGSSGIMQSAAHFKRWGRKNPFLRYGLPLVSLCVFGSFGLAHLVRGRTEVAKEKDDMEWEVLENTRALSRIGPTNGDVPRKKISLEEELKAMQEKIDIYNFDYKKVPKPTGGQATKN